MKRLNHAFLFFAAITVTIPLIFTAAFTTEASRIKPKSSYKNKRSKPVLRKTFRPRVRILSKDPYLGAIVVDTSTGEILFSDRPDVSGYPASLTKMMTLLVVLGAVESGKVSLNDKITVSAEVSRIGGSQVYLKEKEVFTLEELLYALMVQSANDAALAVALHTAGTKEEFVALMNKKADELGMKNTVFNSVHGLPPGTGQLPDISTPRDLSKLAIELTKHPAAIKYTSTKVRRFRPDAEEPFIMRNHNHLVGDFDGCDGLKTGFFYAAGFSIAATAKNGKGRAVAVILGSSYSKVRDEKARELLASGLTKIAARQPPPTPPEKTAEASMLPLDRPESENFYLFVLGLACGSVFVFRRFNVKSVREFSRSGLRPFDKLRD